MFNKSLKNLYWLIIEAQNTTKLKVLDLYILTTSTT